MLIFIQYGRYGKSVLIYRQSPQCNQMYCGDLLFMLFVLYHLQTFGYLFIGNLVSQIVSHVGLRVKMAIFRRFKKGVFYSHSIVAGGLVVISYTTLLIFFTSFTILAEHTSNTSYGIFEKSAVIKSVVSTALSASV